MAWGILAFCLLILSVGLKRIVNMVILVFVLTIFIYSKVNQDLLQIDEAESERASENLKQEADKNIHSPDRVKCDRQATAGYDQLHHP